MSGHIISTTITNSVTLGSAHYRSPLTITSTGEITVIGVGVVIPAAETNGIVLNHGTIISQAVGVSQAAGSVYNAGLITAAIDGFLLSGGVLSNAGRIAGANYGLSASGGSITNLLAGSISGDTIGVNLYGVASLTNDGAITATHYAAALSGSASLTNDAKIEGIDNGLELSGNARLTNNGDVTATYYDGLRLSGNASVVNYGTIVASKTIRPRSSEGVVMVGGNLTNDGSIYGTKLGILLDGGTVENAGTVTGHIGAAAVVEAGLFINTGLLDDTFNPGFTDPIGLLMIAADGGTATNSGEISGVIGIEIGAGTVTNSGVVSGRVEISPVNRDPSIFVNSGTVFGTPFNSYAGITETGGAVFNLAGGRIFGAGDGVVETDGAHLNNDGSINGPEDGLSLVSAFAINSASGSISGDIGVSLVAARLTNFGKISGINMGVDAITGVNGSRSTLTNHGSIYGGREGLRISGADYAVNRGDISGGFYGVQAYSTTSLVNDGSISGGIFGAVVEGLITNAGDISGRTFGAEVTSLASTISGSLRLGTLLNSGTVSGTSGVDLIHGSVGNSGVISGTEYGVVLRGGSLSNSGKIYGGKFGVEAFGGSLTNAGTIGGGADAVYGVFVTLTVDPGAVFDGDVENAAGTSLLELAGTTAGIISGIGGKIFGFTDISFASGSEWQLAGDKAGLATGQQINGFAQGDKIVFDGFAARSDSYVTGVGLVLADAIGKVTLDITGSFSTGDFDVTTLRHNTTIALAAAPAVAAGMVVAPAVLGSTISGTITHEVTLGGGHYLSPLTLTRSGEVNANPGDIGILVAKGAARAAVINHGIILASPSGPAGAAGISADYSTLSVLNSGTISGYYGIDAANLNLDNSGTIAGAFRGAQGFYSARILNSGNIYGGLNGFDLIGNDRLINTSTGTISGGGKGPSVLAAAIFVESFPRVSIINAGLIIGDLGTDPQIGILIDGVGKPTDITNSGTIVGGTEAIGQFNNEQGGKISIVNSGLIVGNRAIDTPYDAVSITNSGTISGAKDAITGVSIALTVDPGAVFVGDVVDTNMNGLLELHGKSGFLGGVGSTFTGFHDIDFDSGSKWTIEGNRAGLASKQQINGFAPGDKIELSEFLATSDTYVTGVGLVLANASGTETLDIVGRFSTGDFVVTTTASNTTISLAAAHSLDQVVMLDVGNGKAGAEMGFLSPAAGVAAPLGNHASNNFAALFSEIRGANAEAVHYLARLEQVNSRSPDAVATLAAHGISPAVLGLNGLSEQHYGNGASIPLPTFAKL